MAVSVDVGELAEATRALRRVVEEQADKKGEEAVDIEVLERLVHATIRGATDSAQTTNRVEDDSNKMPKNPNEGAGLYPRLDELFRNIILTRFSNSTRIWRARAQLLTWKAQQGRPTSNPNNTAIRPWSDALEAYTAAYRAGVVADPRVEVDLERWREAVGEVEEFVDVLRNFGPRAAAESNSSEGSDGKQKREGSWAFQARSVVRTFMGRTRDSFEDEPEWERLVALSEDLKGTK